MNVWKLGVHGDSGGNPSLWKLTQGYFRGSKALAEIYRRNMPSALKGSSI